MPLYTLHVYLNCDLNGEGGGSPIHPPFSVLIFEPPDQISNL